MSDRQFPCNSCGANLLFTPGQQSLTCPYCDSANEIEVKDIPIVENDFLQKVKELESNPNPEDVIEVTEIKCDACGAEFSIRAEETAGECAYCATPFVLQPHTETILRPQALLPFKITSEDGKNKFREWTGKLWFAPNKLKEYARTCEKLKGIYLPHWTYDSHTVTSYMGSRGEHYYVTESYTDSEGNRQTRQVRKTRWWPASGTISNKFDDILVVANESLPRKYTEELEPWDLPELVPYAEEYLSGFSSERYSIGLGQGFEIAKEMVDGTILQTIRRDIGGDEQRIHTRHSNWNDVTFKHVLLPVWVSAYRFESKVYRIVINARTGEVQGERPWSVVKIVLAVVAVIAVIGGLIYMFNK
jgi:DNA-directed RNA polymerase subunit RPC12/RpoP